MLGLHAAVADVMAIAGLSDPVGPIDEATASDLLRVRSADGPWSVEFTHPLVRAAVYDAIGPAARYTLHTAAARVSADEAALTIEPVNVGCSGRTLAGASAAARVE